MTVTRSAVLTVPLFGGIPWLVHGFGSAEFREEDFARTEGLRDFKLVIMRQLHSDIIHRLEAAPARRLEGDALITEVPALLLIVRTADCLPVLVTDTVRRVVAAVHCGWRGTRSRMLEKAIREMRKVYGSEPEDLIAALGPCIGPCCYEVGPDVRASFAAAGFPESVFRDGPAVDLKTAKGRPFLDLRTANRWLLESTGVPPSRVADVEACTHCEPGLVSYRRNKGDRRRLYNFIGIRP